MTKSNRRGKPSAAVLGFWRELVASEKSPLWQRFAAFTWLKRAGVDVGDLTATELRPRQPEPRQPEIATLPEMQALWRTWVKDERIAVEHRRKSLKLLVRSGADVSDLKHEQLELARVVISVH